MFPETFGCDVIMSSPDGWVGVQRKEIKDLLASINDRRLGEQVAKMSGLAVKVLVVEGKVRWTDSGEMLGDRWTRMNRGTLRKILWGLRRQGVWVEWTDSLSDTVQLLGDLETWSRKKKHRGLVPRGAAQSVWGKATNRDFQLFMLQGLPGVGPDTAERILDEAGMIIGLKPDAVERLGRVRGVGPKTIEKIREALGDAED